LGNAAAAVRLHDGRADRERLEERANHLRYVSRLYDLRNHIGLVREGLKKHAGEVVE
jgi:hypothetical protein